MRLTHALEQLVNNHRVHPRIQVNLPCIVQHRCGYNLSVTAINLSQTGLMIEATDVDFKTIITHQKQVTLNHPVEADIRLELGNEDQSDSISSLCRAIYVRRISQNKYRIGFKFLSISPADEEKISQYILVHLKG